MHKTSLVFSTVNKGVRVNPNPEPDSPDLALGLTRQEEGEPDADQYNE